MWLGRLCGKVYRRKINEKTPKTEEIAFEEAFFEGGVGGGKEGTKGI